MVNLSTPYDDMYHEIWYEYEKQEYWVSKWLKSNNKSLKELTVKSLKTESKLVEKIEYNKKLGNRWINYLYAMPIVGNRSSVMYQSVLYWEGYGSFGTFYPTIYGGDNMICIFTTHYWQRYCERSGASMRGVHTAMDFYAEHPSNKIEILPPAEGDKRRQICIHFTCGAAFGVEVSEEYMIFEMRTYIDNESMTGEKARHHADILRTMYSDSEKKGLTEADSILRNNPDINMCDALKYISSEYVDDTVHRIAKDTEKIISERMLELRKTMTHHEAVEHLFEVFPLDTFSGLHSGDGIKRMFIAVNDKDYIEEGKIEHLNAFISELESDGSKLPEQNDILVRDVYEGSFVFGVDVLIEYICIVHGIAYGCSKEDVGTLQEYKHREFLKAQKYLDGLIACYHDEVITYIQRVTSARAFDDGMKFAAEIANNYLDLGIISISKE